MLAKSLNKPNFPGSRLHLKLMKEFDQKLTFQPIIAQTPPPQDSVPGTAAPASGPENGPGATEAPQNPMGALLLPVLMIVVMYFVLIRPQQKKMKEHDKLLSKLEKGDKISTTGGLIATIITIQDAKVTIRSGDSKLEIKKSNISEVLERSSSSTPTSPTDEK